MNNYLIKNKKEKSVKTMLFNDQTYLDKEYNPNNVQEEKNRNKIINKRVLKTHCIYNLLNSLELKLYYVTAYYKQDYDSDLTISISILKQILIAYNCMNIVYFPYDLNVSKNAIDYLENHLKEVKMYNKKRNFRMLKTLREIVDNFIFKHNFRYSESDIEMPLEEYKKHIDENKIITHQEVIDALNSPLYEIDGSENIIIKYVEQQTQNDTIIQNIKQLCNSEWRNELSNYDFINKIYSIVRGETS